MKKYHSFFILVALLTFTQVVLAHPPSKVDLDFNRETGILTVTAIHPVEDRTEHFIYLIEVKVNDENMVVQHFLSQLYAEKQVVPFFMHDLKAGDKLEVTAHCNIFGKKKVTKILEDN